MWRSLLLPLCPKGVARQPRDRGMDGAQQLQHIGQVQGDQKGTWPWPRVQHRQGHRAGHRACAAQRVRRWLSLSGQDCRKVRALFWCGEGTSLPMAGACVVPWGVEDFSLC